MILDHDIQAKDN